MRIHTNLYTQNLRNALARAKNAGKVTQDVTFVVGPELHGSRTHDHGIEVQLGTYDKTTGPTKSRHYKNTGTHGAGDLWAATYDEWGWFLTELFEMDPSARAGQYNGVDDFHHQTRAAYRLADSAF